VVSEGVGLISVRLEERENVVVTIEMDVVELRELYVGREN